MSTHHLKINLDKSELLFLPGKGSPTHDLTITFDNSVLATTQTATNLGVTLDSQLSLTANIIATTRSCRCCTTSGKYFTFSLRRQRRFWPRPWSSHAYSLLAGLPASTIQPLQLIQNAAARLVFNLPKFTHTTPLPSLVTSGCPHPFRTLVLAYHAANRSGPVYIRDMVKPYTPARSLCSASANRLVAPSLQAKHTTKSRLLALLTPKWWNEHPKDIRTAESLHIFHRKLKTSLFQLNLELKKIHHKI